MKSNLGGYKVSDGGIFWLLYDVIRVGFWLLLYMFMNRYYNYKLWFDLVLCKMGE